MTSVPNAQPQIDRLRRQRRRRGAFGLTSFDRAVVITAVCVLALMGVTLLLGDRVGVTLERVSPLGTARATSPIKIQFSEPMARADFGDRLRIEPAVPGTVSWSGTTLIFTPDEALEPGTTYDVMLEPGATAESGRAVLNEYRFSFTIQRPRVAYLAPADSTPINVWIAEPGLEGSARQLTNAPGGIYDFSVSPDGQYIAYSQTNTLADTEDIMLLDLDTGEVRQLTNCVDSSCTNPTWRPDGQVIAYERVDYNSDIEGVGISPTRVWLIDVTANPATTTPLFTDTQVLGYDPQWSADGSRIAIFDRGSASILIYDFNDDSGTSIPTRAGTSGALAPGGSLLVYPEVQLREGQEARTALQIADLTLNAVNVLPGTTDVSSDESAIWAPDGETLAVGRRYFDERFSRGYQIVLINSVTGETTELTDDPRFSNGFFSYDASGEHLVLQRLALYDEQGQPDNLARPQIWTLDIDSGELTFIADNAFHPRWVP